MYSRDTGRGNSREGGGAGGILAQVRAEVRKDLAVRTRLARLPRAPARHSRLIRRLQQPRGPRAFGGAAGRGAHRALPQQLHQRARRALLQLRVCLSLRTAAATGQSPKSIGAITPTLRSLLAPRRAHAPAVVTASAAPRRALSRAAQRGAGEGKREAAVGGRLRWEEGRGYGRGNVILQGSRLHRLHECPHDRRDLGRQRAGANEDRRNGREHGHVQCVMHLEAVG